MFTAEHAEIAELFWRVIHPNLLCALGGLCGDYFPQPGRPLMHPRPRTDYQVTEVILCG